MNEQTNYTPSRLIINSWNCQTLVSHMLRIPSLSIAIFRGFRWGFRPKIYVNHPTEVVVHLIGLESFNPLDASCVEPLMVTAINQGSVFMVCIPKLSFHTVNKPLDRVE